MFVCEWGGGGEGDATLPPQQLTTTIYQQEHPFSCTNQQNQKNHFQLLIFQLFFSSQHFLYKNWILYVFKKKKKKAKKIKTLFKVYLKLSLWLFNLNFEKEISQ